MAQLVTTHYLKLPSGQKVESTQDYADYITDVILKKQPEQVSTIAKILNKNERSIQRYLKLCGDKVVKIEGSHQWKLAKSQTSKRQLVAYKDKKDLDKVYQTQAFKRFDDTCEVKNPHKLKKSLAFLCIGKRIKGVSFHPDNFEFPDTAKLLRDGFRKQNNSTVLIPSQKKIIRQFIDFCTDISLDKISRDLRKMGIDGDKPEANQSDLEMNDEQYNIMMNSLLEESTEYYLKF